MKLERLPVYCQLMDSEDSKGQNEIIEPLKCNSQYHLTDDIKNEMFYKTISKMLSIENIERKIL